MAFVARTFEQILSDMINYVQANTIISDFTVGSVARTILEAAAFEDDEQYYQMIQLLDAFSIISASGQDLDDRLADYNLVRRNPTQATSRVRIANKNLVTNQVAFDATIGATSITLFTTSAFPTTYPYAIRLGEGANRTQDVQVIGNNTGNAVLTLATPLLYESRIGDRCSLVDVTKPVLNVNLGTSIQVPPTVGNPARIFSTQETASILTGNYLSNEILVRANDAGAAGNVGSNRISQFVANPPFSGAIIASSQPAGGGRDRETDTAFRTRALGQLQSLSRGTPAALKSGALDVRDPATGKRVTSANIIEDFEAREVNLYIDDGTGLVPTVQHLGQTSLASAFLSGSSTITVADSSGFPSSGQLLIEIDPTANAAEFVEYTFLSNNIFTLTAPTTTNHDSGAIVNFVEVVTSGAESGQRRFSLNNFPVVRFSQKLFINPGTGWFLAAPEVDYKLNRGTGEFQIIDATGVAQNARIVASYDYYTNLIAQVQKVLEGDSNNPTSFPGLKAAGIFLNVEAPVLRRISVRASISVEKGYTESDVAPLVVERIENYIRTLGIGEDVILSKLVDVAHNVTGLRDINIQIPSDNITILENELPVPFGSNNASLIQVF